MRAAGRAGTGPPSRDSGEVPVVLVVEDDDDIRSVMCDTLEEDGYAVLQAGNGKEALELLLSDREAAPALMLLDLGMPVMRGEELLNVLGRPGPLSGFPIVLISATMPHLNPIQQAAVAGFLRKPYTLDLLLETAGKLVGRARS
jgi:two-component system response regulator VicR